MFVVKSYESYPWPFRGWHEPSQNSLTISYQIHAVSVLKWDREHELFSEIIARIVMDSY